MKVSRIVFAVLLVSGLNNVAFAQPEVELAKTAIPEIQAQIRTTALAFLSGGNSESEIKTNWQGFRELAKLKELAKDEEQLVKQLGIFAVLEKLPQDHQVLQAVLVLQLLQLKPSVPIRILAPFLGSDDPKLREFAQIWFQQHDNVGSDSPLLQVNYDDYAAYVGTRLSRNEDVPPAFTEFIFTRAPERALLVFYRGERARDLVPALKAMGRNLQAVQRQMGAVDMPPPQAGEPSGNVARLEALARKLATAREQAQIPEQVEVPQPKNQDREVLLAEHIISNAIWLNKNGFDKQFEQALPEAIELLAKLTEHEQWWVRLYVAETMRQNRDFRQDDALEKLSRDDNELLSKAAKAVLNRGVAVPRNVPREVAEEVPLVAPREVEARAIGEGSVRVDWQASVGATNYSVLRRQPDTEADFTTIATDVTATSYTDRTGMTDTLYEYRVMAHQNPDSTPSKNGTGNDKPVQLDGEAAQSVKE